MVSKIATLKDRNGNKLLPRTVFEAVQSNSGNTLDSALNQFISWKELTMNNDGTFDNVKCADWYSDKIYVEGQTVKNYAVQSKQYGTLRDFTLKGSWGNQYNFASVDFVSKSSYKIFIDVKEFTSDTSFDLYVRIPYFGDYKLGEISKAGKYKFLFSLGDYDSTKPNLAHLRCLRGRDGEILINYFVIVDENCVVNDFFTGLNSLGDTKDGRTYISLESNGCENQIEIAEPLKKVGNVADVIDGNVLTRKIMQDTYTGKEDWRMVASQSDKYLRFNLTDIKIKPVGDIIGINCDLLEPQTFANIYNGTKEGISVQNVNTALSVNINKTKLSTQDDTGFKAWLQANSVTVQYQLATPTVEQVKSTFVYTPNQNGECSFKFNNAVVPSNSKLSVAQTTQLLLNNKLDKTDVVNTKTETVLGKALDATQNNPNVGGSLANQIGVLSKDKADKTYVDTQDNALDGRITALQSSLPECASPETLASYIKKVVDSKGVHSGYFRASGVSDLPVQDWGFGVYFRQIEGAYYYVQIDRSLFKNQHYYRELNIAEPKWNYDWQTIATTDKIDISSKLVGGWKVLDENCTLEANIVGGVLFVNGLIKNDGTSVVCLDLSEYPPLIKKWHGGIAIGSNGVSKWFVIDPYGSVQFQGGHELGLAYSIHFNYRVY